MRTRKLLVGIVAGLGLFTACSPATAAGPSPAATAAGTAPATSAPATSAAAPAGDIDVEEFVARLVEAQDGVRTYTMDVTMETAMMGEATTMVMKGVVDQSNKDDISMSMDMDVAGMTMKLLKVDGDMYLQMGATGRKWMKVPKEQMAQYEGTAEAGDLASGLEKSKDAMRDIELVGEETVDGAKTRHYTITLDADALPTMTGSDASVSAETFEYDVWIDEANLMRKVAMDVTAEADGEDLPVSVDGVMGHYNEPVSITAPRKADLIQMGG